MKLISKTSSCIRPIAKLACDVIAAMLVHNNKRIAFTFFPWLPRSLSFESLGIECKPATGLIYQTTSVVFHLPASNQSVFNWNARVLGTGSGQNGPAHGSEPLGSPAPIGQSAGVWRVAAEKMYVRALDLL